MCVTVCMCTCCSVGTSITACTLRWNCFLRFSPADRFLWQISTGCKPKWTVNTMQCAPAAAVWITATQWQTDVSYQKWLLVPWAGQFFHGKKKCLRKSGLTLAFTLSGSGRMFGWGWLLHSRTGVKLRWEYVSKAESLALLCSVRPQAHMEGKGREWISKYHPNTEH